MPILPDPLSRTYDAFNRRDIDTLMATIHDEVQWWNGLDGGTIDGKETLRAFWLREWTQIDPHVEPLNVAIDPSGRVRVTAHQVVRDLDGTLRNDSVVEHVFTLENGVIRRADIGGAEVAS